MSFAIKTTLRNVESYLAKSGYFGHEQVGEPKSPPSGQLTAAVFMSSVRVAQVTLGTTIEEHVVTIRIYEDMLSEPTEAIEFDLAEVVSKVMSDLCGEYDLGVTIRNVDVAGQYGTALSARWGYVEVGGRMYRITDITTPLVVDDSASLAA